MSDFEKYIEAKYPNRSPKILFQKFKDIDGTLFYGIKEVEDQAEAWNHQQSKIDELQKQVDAAKQLIEDLNKCYQQDHQNKFEYWRGFADSAGILRKRLEQALKGGDE